jgi:hypothetical protein
MTVNKCTSEYITIHQHESIYLKIRREYTCTPRIYTVDYFPICHHIHHQPSPSMTVH